MLTLALAIGMITNPYSMGLDTEWLVAELADPSFLALALLLPDVTVPLELAMHTCLLVT
jgi:hypothetical protein